MERFTDYCVGQLSDAWGESLEQKYMRTECGEINISFWSDDESWALVPEDEYLSDNTQDSDRRTQAICDANKAFHLLGHSI